MGQRLKLISLHSFFFIIIAGLMFLGLKFFVLSSYLRLEKENNYSHIESIIYSLETKQRFLYATASDNGEWDATYDFINGKNPTYFEDNFRDYEQTLEDLDVDWMIFTDRQGKVLLELSLKDKRYMNAVKYKVLQKDFVEKDYSTFLRVQNDMILYHRHLISTSDGKKTPNGYLYVGDTISIDYLKSATPEILRLTMRQKENAEIQLSRKGKGDYRFNVAIEYFDEEIKNSIQVINGGSKYVTTICATVGRELYLTGKQSVYIFWGIAIVIIAVIFFLLLMREKHIESENERLAKMVDKKTSALNSTMQELQTTLKKLEKIAYVDELTGVHTRRSFFEKVTKWLEKAHRNDVPYAFALIDLDDFKNINDTYGHDVGDFVLKDFCQTCQSLLKKEMMMARLGGEEFVICFHNSTLIDAENFCSLLQNTISETMVKTIDNTHIGYSLSIGLASNEHTSDIDEILKEADEHLYSAKRSGKNTIRKRHR